MWLVSLLWLSSITHLTAGVRHNGQGVSGYQNIGNYSTNDSFNKKPLTINTSDDTSIDEVDSHSHQFSNGSDKCVLSVCEKCVSRFRHVVYYSEAEFVYLNFVLSEGVHIIGEKSTLQVERWVWTFYGRDGGLEFLHWPIEFGIWSMGLLTSYVITKPMDILLIAQSGNCSNLRIGNLDDEMIISKALSNLTIALERAVHDDKYDASFFCHMQRKYIETDFLYVLCKHIVCPLEALQYKCCNYYYNTTISSRMIGCWRESFEFDPISWMLPTLISVLVFVVCPLFLLKIAYKTLKVDPSTNLSSDLDSTYQQDRVRQAKNLIFLNDKHHVTLFGTILRPFRVCFRYMVSENGSIIQNITRRILRYCLACASLSSIVLQVALDYFYLHSFVLASVDKGVPLGFRSMLAGYDRSRDNFLPFLGGPYIAVGVYLFITFVLVGIPASVPGFLVTGLPTSPTSDDLSILSMPICSIEKFGSLSIRRKHGFNKIYNFLLGQFFMLINIRFWRHVFTIQYKRWIILYCTHCLLLLFPVYVVGCLLEIVLCIIYFGCPILSFGVVIIKAYFRRLWKQSERRSFPQLVLFFVLTVVLVSSVLYFFFILCTIFMDACVFICRVLTFTFTGIVVYPKVSYGYIIFFFTIVYYIMQSLHDFSSKYQSLLRETIYVCEQRQRANDTNKLVAKMGGFKGVSTDLFERVIEEHCPRRKQVFLSFVKVCVILTVLGISLNVLIETDGFRELHVVMHVGTALLICALPQIVKSTCRNSDNRFGRKRLRNDIAKTVRNYSGYCNTGETSDSDLVEIE